MPSPVACEGRMPRLAESTGQRINGAGSLPAGPKGDSVIAASIWTDILPNQPLSEVLHFLHPLGWDCFELSTEHLEEIDNDADPRARIEDTSRMLRELGVDLPQAHAYLRANVAHPDEARRQSDLDTLLRHFAHCAQLGVRDVVVHPGVGLGHSTRDELREIIRLNVESFKLLCDRAGEVGLRLCVENMLPSRNAGRQSFGIHPHELLGLLEEVDSAVLGVVFDTSHANVSGLDIGAAIRELGSTIWCTHLSDNDGTGDQHLIPGDGDVDWPTAMAALREVGYTGRVNLEIPGALHPVREVLALKMRHARQIAGWLVEQLRSA